MSQAFYRKWRPHLWDQVIGQEHVIQTLRNAVRSGRVGHAYLFAGPRGTGKTTTARLLAKAVNCLDPDPGKRPCDACEHCTSVNDARYLDLIEIDAASNTSVDDVRDLRDKINFSPSQGEYKVYIIDEVHMLSTAAFNALLKTLEEPPPHAIFILATTEVHKIPATVLSRCQKHEFRRVPVAQITGLLSQMAKDEKLEVDDDALLLIARQATGSVRDAISLLDQLSSTGKRVTLAEAQVVLGTATNETVLALVNAILARDAAAGLSCIQSALDAGSDARQFARQVVEYLRGVLLVRLNNAGLIDATAEGKAHMATQAARFETAHLLEVIRLFNEAAVDTRSSWQPGLGLELALAESVEERAAVSAPPVEQTAQPEPPASAASARSEARRDAPARVNPLEQRRSVEEAKPAEAGEAPKQAAQSKSAAPEGQKTAPAPAQAEGGPGEANSAPGLAEIRANWARIRQAVKQRSGLTAAALNSCKTFTLKDGVLILGYQTELVKSKMETDENLALLREALKAVIGGTFPVRCVVVGNKATIEVDDVDVAGDGMVRTALDLGGVLLNKSDEK
jgi:DNA polymerase-3 subunit gamma/tau